jgi:hypothetical protein
MANQISRQFGYLPEGEAATKVAYHLHTFWESRMIAGLDAHATLRPDDLEPVVLAATRILSEQYGAAAPAH